MSSHPIPRVVRSTFTKTQLHTTDGRSVAALYASTAQDAVVLIPSDASSWEEKLAARIVVERAHENGKPFEAVMLDELPPRPRLIA